MTSTIIVYIILIASIGGLSFLLKKILETQKDYNKNNSEDLKQIKDTYFDNKQSLQKTTASFESKLKMYEEKVKSLENKISNLKNELSTIKNRDSDLNKISEYFSIGKPISIEEINKFESKSKSILNEFNNLSYINFTNKYNNYKVFGVSNFDEIMENNRIPANLSEISIGDCIAIEIEKEIYSIFINKNLEIKDSIFQSSGIMSIFHLSETPLKGFSYSNWKILKTPIFQKLSNNKWFCIEKGYLELRSEDALSDHNEFIKDDNILNELNLLKENHDNAINEVKNFSESVFKKRNSDYIELDFYNNDILKKVKIGKLISFKTDNFKDNTNLLSYYLFPKSELLSKLKDQSSSEYELVRLFFDISYKNVKSEFIDNLVHINMLAIINKYSEEEYKLTEKGQIIVFLKDDNL